MTHAFRYFVLSLALIYPDIALSAKPDVSSREAMHNKQQAARLSSEEQDVWRVIEQWNAAFAANDAKRYFHFIDDDITVITPSNPYRVEGLPDDLAEFEFGIRQGYARVGFFQEIAPIVRVYDDFAFVTYFNRGYYGAEENGEIAYLKETTILRRTDDSWKIVHIHVSR